MVLEFVPLPLLQGKQTVFLQFGTVWESLMRVCGRVERYFRILGYQTDAMREFRQLAFSHLLILHAYTEGTITWAINSAP